MHAEAEYKIRSSYFTFWYGSWTSGRIGKKGLAKSRSLTAVNKSSSNYGLVRKLQH
jgi:hypothetical protein